MTLDESYAVEMPKCKLNKLWLRTLKKQLCSKKRDSSPCTNEIYYWRQKTHFPYFVCRGCGSRPRPLFNNSTGLYRMSSSRFKVQFQLGHKTVSDVQMFLSDPKVLKRSFELIQNVLYKSKSARMEQYNLAHFEK